MRRSATAKSDSRCRHGGRWILLAGASPVKQLELPLLPGGAIILCHFWNKVVFKQSRGDNAYALCLDISSCIGSKITHNCKRTTLCYKPAVSQESSSLPVLPVLEHARARLRFLWTFNRVRERSTKQRWTQHVCAILYKFLCTILRQFFVQIEIKAKHPHLTHFVCSYNSVFRFHLLRYAESNTTI